MRVWIHSYGYRCIWRFYKDIQSGDRRQPPQLCYYPGTLQKKKNDIADQTAIEREEKEKRSFFKSFCMLSEKKKMIKRDFDTGQTAMGWEGKIDGFFFLKSLHMFTFSLTPKNNQTYLILAMAKRQSGECTTTNVIVGLFSLWQVFWCFL